MGIDYCAVRESVIARYPFMGTNADELDYLFGTASVPLGALAAAAAARNVETVGAR
jgi:hypothetical protein